MTLLEQHIKKQREETPITVRPYGAGIALSV